MTQPNSLCRSGDSRSVVTWRGRVRDLGMHNHGRARCVRDVCAAYANEDYTALCGHSNEQHNKEEQASASSVSFSRGRTSIRKWRSFFEGKQRSTHNDDVPPQRGRRRWKNKSKHDASAVDRRSVLRGRGPHPQQTATFCSGGDRGASRGTTPSPLIQSLPPHEPRSSATDSAAMAIRSPLAASVRSLRAMVVNETDRSGQVVVGNKSCRSSMKRASALPHPQVHHCPILIALAMPTARLGAHCSLPTGTHHAAALFTEGYSQPNLGRHPLSAFNHGTGCSSTAEPCNKLQDTHDTDCTSPAEGACAPLE